jgi:Barstar (barnase inhibitor)
MRETVLDGSTWKTRDDVCDAFFEAVGAPEWHGCNFKALIDSIEGAQINAIEAPYRLIVRYNSLIGEDHAGLRAISLILIHEIAARGCPIQIVVEG